MKTIAEYQRHAEDCRKLARTASSEAERRQLLKIAEMWEDLARYRERQVMLGRNPTENSVATPKPRKR